MLSADESCSRSYNAHQLTVYDELARIAADGAPGGSRLIAGMISHLGNLDNDALVRLGRLCRREASTATKRHRTATSLLWSNLLGACTSEWLRRQASA